MTLGELTLEEAAQKAAGNWRRFESFAWFRRDELDDAAQLGSDLHAQSR